MGNWTPFSTLDCIHIAPPSHDIAYWGIESYGDYDGPVTYDVNGQGISQWIFASMYSRVIGLTSCP